MAETVSTSAGHLYVNVSMPSAAATSRLPSPEQAETGAMPTNNRLRLHDQSYAENWVTR